MKKRSQRINLVADLAYQAECEVARALEQAQNELNSANAQLEELQTYYASYSESEGSGAVAASANKLQMQRSFLQHLHQAIEQQIQRVDGAKQRYELVKATWIRSHTKTENLKGFVADCEHAELRVEDKREQKQTDEWVSQRQGSTKK